MQLEVEHNQNANSGSEDGCSLPRIVPSQLAASPSPLDVVSADASDETDWVSYPAFYPHVVQLESDEGRASYGIRMRGADGRLTLLHGPKENLEEVRRQVELRWLYFLDAVLDAPRYGDEERAEELHHDLYTLEKSTCTEPPPGARSPFQTVDLEKIEQADLQRYPVGYPFVVSATDDRGRYSTAAMIRTEDLEFRTFRRLTGLIGEGEVVIKWSLTMKVPGIEFANWMTVRAVNQFHVHHCKERGIRPANCPEASKSMVPYC